MNKGGDAELMRRKSARARVALSIGCNLGDREYYMAMMEDGVYAILEDAVSSPLMETEPVGVGDVQPPYLNKIITGYYCGDPSQLLEVCFSIETTLGRVREKPKGARTADVDILLFGDVIINDDALTIPHPQLLNRRFCVEGLARIDPSITVPGGSKSLTIGEHYKNMSAEVAAQKVSFIQ